jgi:hypothetical protein
MTKTARRSVRVLGLVWVGLLAFGCNTTPERPPPPPLPRAEPSPPPPPQSTTPRTEPVAQDIASPAAATDVEPTYAPPSANAAEVEFEEIPVDDNGNPLPAAPAAAALPASSQEAETSGASGARAAGGGGGNMPLARMNDVIEARERGAASGAALSPAESTANPDLVGPRMAVGTLTTAEQIAATDAELDAGLAAFDERMRRARAAAEAERRLSGGGAPAGSVDGRGQRSVAPAEAGAGGAAATGTGLGNTPDLSGTATGTPTARVAGTPSGLPDGRDDDIVARQLREAAQRESDPVLQAKLWDEYRKYKAGL